MISLEAWRPAAGLILEPNAEQAVTLTDRNVVVTAGPGAGKTELLAQRADFLLRTGTCPYPKRILAISFKRDAARNLKERVRQRCGGPLASRFDSYTFHAFAKRLIDNYRPVLTGINALNPDYSIDERDRIPLQQITFDDLAPFATEILQHSRYARLGLQQTYSQVFLDEFQDATSDQYQLLKEAFLGSPAHLTAVGDVKQRIMAWAGALDGVLEAFAGDFDAKPLPLYQNRRSAPRLRRMQNRMVKVTDPGAAAPDSDILGDEGVIRTLQFKNDIDEASAIAELVRQWLAEGVPPTEIAVLVRQQPHLVAAPLMTKLSACGVAVRNEQRRQDLTAEPGAALVLALLRVLILDRQPEAYEQLMRIATRSGTTEEAGQRFDSVMKRFLREQRAAIRSSSFDQTELTAWKAIIYAFLNHLTGPALLALSPGYQQGTRLEDIIEQTLQAFEEELVIDGSAGRALDRLSESDAIRILTIQKCKGLEFTKVIVLGVENELFWSNQEAMRSEFFVAISRAKNELVLTAARRRERPAGFTDRWDVSRTPHSEFLGYAAGLQA